MTPVEGMALLRLFAAAALGYVHQWAMFAPKKVPSWLAWLALGLATTLLYWWATPSMTADFAANWRLSIVGVIEFFLTAKGTGSTAKSIGIAPQNDSK